MKVQQTQPHSEERQCVILMSGSQEEGNRSPYDIFFDKSPAEKMALNYDIVGVEPRMLIYENTVHRMNFLLNLITHSRTSCPGE